jgi:hypothetical protein
MSESQDYVGLGVQCTNQHKSGSIRFNSAREVGISILHENVLCDHEFDFFENLLVVG